ncbi:DciA family protein [Streptomyces sp. NBC_01520]|uniref:DciA family protein n=1 Tax=Streptomyces sp. NBC_01520 TaxID=2903892 RepID=UPI0038682EB1
MNQPADGPLSRAVSGQTDLALLALRYARENARRPRSRALVPARRKRETQSVLLRTALYELATQAGWMSDGYTAVLRQWARTVGLFANHVSPVRFDQKTRELVVQPDSAAWATQMRLLAGPLVARLNQELGEGTVRTLKVLHPKPAETSPSPAADLARRPLQREALAKSSGSPQLRKATERQARQMPREPDHLFPAFSADDRSEEETGQSRVRSKALFRAQAERARRM